MNYRRIGRYAFAAAGVAAAGAGLWWLREKRIETPNYRTVLADGDYELRDYPPLIVAETVQVGLRDRALGNGFGVLADYIFAGSREGPKIDMTAPVIAQADDAARWRVRFVMPATYSRSTLPPTGPGIEIVDVPRRRVAALRFAGQADDRLLARKAAVLAERIAAAGLTARGPVQHAFYNSPFMPGPLRQNEVWQEIAFDGEPTW